MSILQQVKQKRNESRNKNVPIYQFYTVILGEFERVAKEVTDDQALAIIKSNIKSRVDVLPKLTGKAKEDIQSEIDELSKFMPPSVPDAVLFELAEAHDNIGAFMKAVGQYAKENGLSVDGRAAKEVFTSSK